MVMPRLNWRWLLALSSVPSFAVLLLYGLAPETPKYLCTAGNMADAAHVLEKMAQRNGTNLPSGMLLSDETATPDEEVIIPEHTPLLSSTVNKSGSSSFLMLLSSELIRTTLLLWFLFFGNSFVYYGVILLTSELNSEEARCGSTLLLLEHAQDASLYVNVFITSLAGKNARCLLPSTCWKNILFYAHNFTAIFSRTSRASVISSDCGQSWTQDFHGNYVHFDFHISSSTAYPSTCYFNNSIIIWSSNVCQWDLCGCLRVCTGGLSQTFIRLFFESA